MIYLAYCSTANEFMDGGALTELLRGCRARNAAAGITGMLLYREGCFMQVIEGEEASVVALYRRIALDPRHRDLIKLAQAPIAQRSFGAWSMGFVEDERLSPEDAEACNGFLYQRAEDTTLANPSRALTLLQRFRDLAH